VSGGIRWSDELFGYTIGTPAEDLSYDNRDSGQRDAEVPVVDSHFHLGADDRSPSPSLNRSVIYECHVRA